MCAWPGRRLHIASTRHPTGDATATATPPFALCSNPSPSVLHKTRGTGGFQPPSHPARLAWQEHAHHTAVLASCVGAPSAAAGPPPVHPKSSHHHPNSLRAWTPLPSAPYTLQPTTDERPGSHPRPTSTCIRAPHELGPPSRGTHLCVGQVVALVPVERQAQAALDLRTRSQAVHRQATARVSSQGHRRRVVVPGSSVRGRRAPPQQPKALDETMAACPLTCPRWLRM